MPATSHRRRLGHASRGVVGRVFVERSARSGARPWSRSPPVPRPSPAAGALAPSSRSPPAPRPSTALAPAAGRWGPCLLALPASAVALDGARAGHRPPWPLPVLALPASAAALDGARPCSRSLPAAVALARAHAPRSAAAVDGARPCSRSLLATAVLTLARAPAVRAPLAAVASVLFFLLLSRLNSYGRRGKNVPKGQV
ncbi:SH3 domain-containing protein C23A1.17-like [Panicum virgatum]|uniref:SH3 domain-containing protein C23A1.17-like n=1 Tax=Panicum virgatum TaxID=38727 RepID=UPI0019D5C0F8|nr:SH3 domain-containing protein C23A1.17-like [Panicum virgatum]